MKIYAIEQQINAGQNFNGQLPSTTPVEDDGVLKYPADNQGGLFSVQTLSDDPWRVRQVFLELGGQSTWRIELYDPDSGLAYRWREGTTEGFVAIASLDGIDVPIGWQLRIFTTGASSAMRALVFIERAYAQRVTM